MVADKFCWQHGGAFRQAEQAGSVPPTQEHVMDAQIEGEIKCLGKSIAFANVIVLTNEMQIGTDILVRYGNTLGPSGAPRRKKQVRDIGSSTTGLVLGVTGRVPRTAKEMLREGFAELIRAGHIRKDHGKRPVDGRQEVSEC